MSGRSRVAFLAAAATVVVAARRPLARLARTIDRRAGIFAPRGASLYNAVAPVLLRPLYRRVAADVAALSQVAAMPEISAVLEVGSGPGEVAVEIARRLPRADIVGVDLASAMVAAATTRAVDEGLADRVRFLLGDAAALPIGDASFDAVVSTLSLHHWADPGTVFAEIGRVLRAGGVALVYDLRPFTYSRDELEVFVAGSPFEGAHLERELVHLGPPPALFVRIGLVRLIPT